jgi:hypothetical protein
MPLSAISGSGLEVGMYQCHYCKAQFQFEYESEGYCWASPEGGHHLEPYDYSDWTNEQLEETLKDLHEELRGTTDYNDRVFVEREIADVEEELNREDRR